MIEVSNLTYVSHFFLKDVEDRLLITADLSREFRTQHQMTHPFLYVTLYARGGVLIKIIDEGTTKMYIPLRKEFEPKSYADIVEFAKRHSKQFQT